MSVRRSPPPQRVAPPGDRVDSPQSSPAELRTPEFRMRAASDTAALGGIPRHGRGSKRQALSSPEASAEAELNSLLLSDAELKNLKADLDVCDGRFSKIMSASKESVAKKEELESALRTYRNAFDKLTMAYVKLKAERDTTKAIWGRVETAVIGRAGDTVGTEAVEAAVTQRFRSMLREETVKMVGTVRGACQVSSEGRRSYASVAGARARGELQESSDGGSTERGTMETLEIMPKKGFEGVMSDALETARAVKEAINPCEAGIKIERMTREGMEWSGLWRRIARLIRSRINLH